MSNVFIVFYSIFFFYHMMHNKDNQFIINWCCWAKEEEYSDDEETQGFKSGSGKGNELKEIGKNNGLDYAVLFEQEAMSIN